MVAEAKMESNINKRDQFSLLEMTIHQKGRVFHVESSDASSRRLSDLGIIPGVVIEKLGEAPFDGPIRICVRGTCLAIGRAIARTISLIPII